jgi:5-methylcytosine-specific restriction endonuclease McrA
MARLYDSKAWLRMRRQTLRAAGWRCSECGLLMQGKGVAQVHHRKALKRAPALGLEPLNLVALCISCHRRIELHECKPQRGCDAFGNPLNESHPWHGGVPLLPRGGAV